MKILYISGPYYSDIPGGVAENVWAAAKAAIGFWKQGWAVICPHLNTAHFENFIKDPRVFLRGDLEFIKRLKVGVDGIYMLKNWKASYGARCEHRLAKRMGLEIYYEEVNDATE